MRKCVMCHAAQPDVDKEINDLNNQLNEANARIKELENAIEEAKRTETKEESDSIFDAL